MLTTKFRRFDFKDGNIIMTPKREGEFIHINDIELYLREQRRFLENMKVSAGRSDPPSEWDKKYEYGLNEQIKFIDHFIDEL